MQMKHKKFSDDAWAVWVDGDENSSVYMNDWINPKGRSYVDMAVRVRGAKAAKALNVYIPFALGKEEINDVSLLFQDRKILYATFSAACIVDYQKNACTSEIAYNGKTVDIVHISALQYELTAMPQGTLLHIDLTKVQPYLDNDEAYFIWRMPHKSLDEIFASHVDVGNALERLRDLFTTPVVSEKYGYSIRINESSLLPDEVTRIGLFHRQKLEKAVVTLSIDESYEINDAGCYRIRRLEENLYRNYLPEDYCCEDVIIYQWNQMREQNSRGQFNFYYGISKDSVSRGSMFLYMLLLMTVSVISNLISSAVEALLGLF